MPKRTYPSGNPAVGVFGDKAATYFNNRDRALQAMLSDIWGEDGISTGQSLFRTEDGKALGTQIVEALDENASGITQKSVRNHMAVAGFFEKNPTGNLLIMMKDDNEPHVLSYDQNKHEYSISEEAFKPKPLPQKPSGWDRFLGFFGNKKAKEKVNTYDTAVKDRKWYDSFKKQGSDLSKSIEKKKQEALAKQEKARAEEAKRVQKAQKKTVEKKKAAQAQIAPAKEVHAQQVTDPFATNDPLLQEAYGNLKKEMAEKPNLTKISPEIHVSTKKGLAEKANNKFGVDLNSMGATNFVMNVARQLVITMIGDAPEIQENSIEINKLNSMVAGIFRTDEFREVINQINVRDKDGDIVFSAQQEKIRDLIKDGGKSLISDGLREKFSKYSDLTLSSKAPTRAVEKVKTNDKVLTSNDQNPPLLGRHG